MVVSRRAKKYLDAPKTYEFQNDFCLIIGKPQFFCSNLKRFNLDICSKTMSITIKDIARLTGTSPAAVSFVLNNKDQKRVNPEKRKAILDAVKEHGYRKNVAARGLVLNRTFRVGLCIHGSFHQYPVHGNFSLYETISLATGKLNELGYGIYLLQTDKDSSPEDMFKTLVQEKLDGILFLKWESHSLKKLLPLVKQTSIPTFALDSILDHDDSWAVIDREAAAHKAISYLLNSGLTKITILNIGQGPYEKLKRSGYKSAMKEFGLKPYPVFSASPSGKSVCATTKKMLDIFPETEAIFVTANIFAPAVVNSISERGKQRCIRIIGLGDACFTDLCDLKLSYMRLPTKELVDFSVETLVNHVESPKAQLPQHRIIECDLVVQET